MSESFKRFRELADKFGTKPFISISDPVLRDAWVAKYGDGSAEHPFKEGDASIDLVTLSEARKRENERL